jgi:hypothetical protein
VVDVASDTAVVELYDVAPDEQPTGRIAIETHSDDRDNGWIGGEIVRRIRTENGRAFVVIKLSLVPHAAAWALQHIANTYIAV